jgi:hypothetical protein
MDDSPQGDDAGADQARATAALQEAFARLQPQGSDAWNFLAAFTHLGDRYGPYQPGASPLSALLEEAGRPPGRRAGRLGRLRPGADRVGSEGEKTELEEAMAQVVEAFRFLSARVGTLEARLAYEDRPVDGAPWLAPAPALGQLVDPVLSYVAASSPGGDILHADCGEGELLVALARAGTGAVGVEPRGGVALRALERGCTVTIAEALDVLAGRPSASLGGVVLSGVVDRLALHDILPLLSQARRALVLDAPVVVVASDPAEVDRRWSAPALDLVAGRPLHAQTWEILLERAGFTRASTLPDVADAGRFAVAASTPA